MSLYTGKGDAGTSKLFTTPSGVRISKADMVFEALGTLDECNSYIGLCKSLSQKGALICAGTVCSEVLHSVQNHLFTIQAEIAGSDTSISADGVKLLEETIATIESELPPITTFFVPGVSELSSHFDVARTISRRAERSVVRLIEAKSEGSPAVSPESLAYLNRLSSLLYALARFVAHTQGFEEKAPEYLR
jgi:cob(I)alamin adenosyltransferase